MTPHRSEAPGPLSTLWRERLEQLHAHRPATEAEIASEVRARLGKALKHAALQIAIAAAVFIVGLVLLHIVDTSTRAGANIASVGLVTAGVIALVLVGRAFFAVARAGRRRDDEQFAPQQAIADLAPFASDVPEIAVIMSDWMVAGRLRMREIHMLRLTWNLWRVERGGSGVLAGVVFEPLDRDE